MGFAVGVLAVLACSRQGIAAETADPSTTATTLVILNMDSPAPVEAQAKFQAQPPILTLEFSGQRIVSSLPERSTIPDGPVHSITTRYLSTVGPQSQRYLQSLQLAFAGAYAYRLRPEPGRLVVEIDHPVSVGSRTMEVGLKGGTIISGLRPRPLSERFLAMQNALTEAMAARRVSPMSTESAGASKPTASSMERGARSESPKAARTIATPERPTGTRPWGGHAPIAGIVAVLALAVLGFWGASRSPWWTTVFRRAPSPEPGGRLPSGVALVDELVWQAFERQGYQLVKAIDMLRPPGTLRVLTKEGGKSALLFVWNGLFFEKRTVEQFVGAMRQIGVETGFLVASGSFTVPAQRVAKEQQVVLIGREQLMELLSAGASSEYFTKQLEQSQARLDEAKETLRQYANQLDTLRRQRNEASWYLGEERAKSAQLEAQIAELGQQLRHHEAEIQRWEQETVAVRKQWEESQWYLGESRERLKHLETQIAELQALTKRVEPAERERDEANWYLGEERAARQALDARLKELERALEASATREHTLQQALDQLTGELNGVRAFGERRGAIRRRLSKAFVDLLDGHEASGAIVSGTLRDLSKSGVGLETDAAIPSQQDVRLRLRLPGAGEPIESNARVVWQQPEGQPPRYHIGCQLLDLSEETCALIEQRIGQHTG